MQVIQWTFYVDFIIYFIPSTHAKHFWIFFKCFCFFVKFISVSQNYTYFVNYCVEFLFQDECQRLPNPQSFFSIARCDFVSQSFRVTFLFSKRVYLFLLLWRSIFAEMLKTTISQTRLQYKRNCTHILQHGTKFRPIIISKVFFLYMTNNEHTYISNCSSTK